jgi:hypothetical protein
VERNFETAQDRLVKGMRVAGVSTLEQANRYLLNDYLVWWERKMTVEPANTDDAHRQLEKSHSLAASLSYVEPRQVRPDYTLRWDGKLYEIQRRAITPGLRGVNVRVEKRLDGTLAVRHGDRYLPIQECAPAEKLNRSIPAEPKRAGRIHKRGSDWNRNFDINKGLKVWQAAERSGRRPEEAMD